MASRNVNFLPDGLQQWGERGIFVQRLGQDTETKHDDGMTMDIENKPLTDGEVINIEGII